MSFLGTRSLTGPAPPANSMTLEVLNHTSISLLVTQRTGNPATVLSPAEQILAGLPFFSIANATGQATASAQRVLGGTLAAINFWMANEPQTRAHYGSARIIADRIRLRGIVIAVTDQLKNEYDFTASSNDTATAITVCSEGRWPDVQSVWDNPVLLDESSGECMAEPDDPLMNGTELGFGIVYCTKAYAHNRVIRNLGNVTPSPPNASMNGNAPSASNDVLPYTGDYHNTVPVGRRGVWQMVPFTARERKAPDQWRWGGIVEGNVPVEVVWLGRVHDTNPGVLPATASDLHQHIHPRTREQILTIDPRTFRPTAVVVSKAGVC